MSGEHPHLEFLTGVGRNEQPKRLYQAWRRGEIDGVGLRVLILDVWSGAEWPAQLGHRAWIEMFTAAGLVTDGCDAPKSPLTVYRGATLSRMRGFSWTLDFDRAQWFAARTRLFGMPAAVYRLACPPTLVLGVIFGEPSGRGEREIIVNPRRLRGRWTPHEVPGTRIFPAAGGDQDASESAA